MGERRAGFLDGLHRIGQLEDGATSSRFEEVGEKRKQDSSRFALHRLRSGAERPGLSLRAADRLARIGLSRRCCVLKTD